MRIETDEFIVTGDDDAATQQALLTRLVAFYVKHKSFSGESVMQSDGPQLEAAELLADIADDVLKFKVQWKEDA